MVGLAFGAWCLVGLRGVSAGHAPQVVLQQRIQGGCGDGVLAVYIADFLGGGGAKRVALLNFAHHGCCWFGGVSAKMRTEKIVTCWHRLRKDQRSKSGCKHAN